MYYVYILIRKRIAYYYSDVGFSFSFLCFVFVCLVFIADRKGTCNPTRNAMYAVVHPHITV